MLPPVQQRKGIVAARGGGGGGVGGGAGNEAIKLIRPVIFDSQLKACIVQNAFRCLYCGSLVPRYMYRRPGNEVILWSVVRMECACIAQPIFNITSQVSDKLFISLSDEDGQNSLNFNTTKLIIGTEREVDARMQVYHSWLIQSANS